LEGTFVENFDRASVLVIILLFFRCSFAFQLDHMSILFYVLICFLEIHTCMLHIINALISNNSEDIIKHSYYFLSPAVRLEHLEARLSLAP
jgi:hypothetical protein